MDSSYIRLEQQIPVMVACEADLNGPAKGRALKLTRQVWSNVLALAETEGFRVQRSQDIYKVNEFAEALRYGLARVQQPVPPGRGTRGSSRFTPTNTLREFFASAANVKELQRVIALAEEGHRLSVVG